MLCIHELSPHKDRRGGGCSSKCMHHWPTHQEIHPSLYNYSWSDRQHSIDASESQPQSWSLGETFKNSSFPHVLGLQEMITPGRLAREEDSPHKKSGGQYAVFGGTALPQTDRTLSRDPPPVRYTGLVAKTSQHKRK